MRIISPFHDYYDTALGLGFDPTLVYRRYIETKVVRTGDVDPIIGRLFEREIHDYRFEPKLAVLGFCGRLFPMYLAPEFSFGVESLSAKLPTSPVLPRAEVDRLAGTPHYTKNTWWVQYSSTWRWEFFDQPDLTASPETFRLIDAPIWLAQRGVWRLQLPESLNVYTNVRLANLDFFTHFDSYSAFQEIAMYLGSVLARTDDSVRSVGSDEILAQQKGFGPESFRNAAPSVRKTRRKENRAKKRSGGES